MATEELQQVILDDVPQCTGGIVVSFSSLEADGLRDGYLHMVDMGGSPDRLKEGIGEAQDEKVLHRLFAQVVVDAKNLTLIEDFPNFLIGFP